MTGSGDAQRRQLLGASLAYSVSAASLAAVLIVHRHVWLALTAIAAGCAFWVALQVLRLPALKRPGWTVWRLLLAGPLSMWFTVRLVRRNRPVLMLRPRP